VDAGCANSRAADALRKSTANATGTATQLCTLLTSFVTADVTLARKRFGSRASLALPAHKYLPMVGRRRVWQIASTAAKKRAPAAMKSAAFCVDQVSRLNTWSILRVARAMRRGGAMVVLCAQPRLLVLCAARAHSIERRARLARRGSTRGVGGWRRRRWILRWTRLRPPLGRRRRATRSSWRARVCDGLAGCVWIGRCSAASEGGGAVETLIRSPVQRTDTTGASACVC